MPADYGRLTVFGIGARSRLRIWHRRGWFSPSLFSHPSGSFQWAMTVIVPVLIVVIPHLASPAVREWSLARLSFVIPGAMIVLSVLCYWWWARGDASARQDLRQIALHGRIAIPAGDLTPDDLQRNPQRGGSTPAFLPRRLRRLENSNDSECCVAGAIPSLLPGEGQRGPTSCIYRPCSDGKDTTRSRTDPSAPAGYDRICPEQQSREPRRCVPQTLNSLSQRKVMCGSTPVGGRIVR